jgi:hypothetical protein
MPQWTQVAAMSELNLLIVQIDELPACGRYSAEHTRWLARTQRFLEDVFGHGSVYYLTFLTFHWSATGTFLAGPLSMHAVMKEHHHQAFVEQLESAKGLLWAARDELQRAGIDSVYRANDTGHQSTAILRILDLIERKLRKTIRTKPERERNVHDSIENLLNVADIEYAREAESIQYSSKTYIPDFAFKKLDLVLEVKLCSHDRREKEMIAEINDDILAYRTKFGNLVFVVYDLGLIRDQERFADEFEKQEGVIVRIIKH